MVDFNGGEFATNRATPSTDILMCRSKYKCKGQGVKCNYNTGAGRHTVDMVNTSLDAASHCQLSGKEQEED